MVRILNHDPNVMLFGYGLHRHGKWMIAAAIDRSSKKLYWISYYAQILDSIQLRDAEYQKIASKQLGPFAYYDTLTQSFVNFIDVAKRQLRTQGQIDPQWQYSSVVADLPGMKDAKNKLQKIVALDKLRESVIMNKWLADNNNPKWFMDVDGHSCFYYDYDDVPPGTMLIKTDTTFYYNQDHMALPYKAILLNRTAQLLFYKMNNDVIDSIQLDARRAALLQKQKADVFMLYRSWLEWRRQNAEEDVQRLKGLMTEPFRLTASNMRFNDYPF